MAHFRKQLLIGLTALGLVMGTAGAYAHEAHEAGGDAKRQSMARGADHGSRAERMKSRADKRRAALHEKLKLDAGQQHMWEQYVAVMKSSAMVRNKSDRNAAAALTAPERMERRLAMLKLHEARMGDRLAATKALYSVLSPEQQKIFNEEFARGQKRFHRPRHHARHRHGHHQQHRHHQHHRQHTDAGH